MDATGAIMPSAKKLYRSYFLGIIGAKLYQFFNPNATELGKNSVHSAYLQYNTLKKGLWKYLIVRAEKDQMNIHPGFSMLEEEPSPSLSHFNGNGTNDCFSSSTQNAYFCIYSNNCFIQ